MTIKMTAKEVRNFHVSYHMINTDNELLGFDGLSKVFDRIKSIQYDPLNVVGRNSDLVLQSRITNYSSSILDKALYIDRTLIDAWDKMMGIYQTKDYPYFSRIRTVMGTNTKLSTTCVKINFGIGTLFRIYSCRRKVNCTMRCCVCRKVKLTSVVVTQNTRRFINNTPHLKKMNRK